MNSRYYGAIAKSHYVEKLLVKKGYSFERVK
mgnify:CR=1 FL=1